MTILERSLQNNRIQSIEGNMPISSQYTAGISGERFLRSLKDHAELLASYCSHCKKSFLPARLFCERCLTRLAETRVAPHDGRLQTFTKAHVDLDMSPLKKPRWIGFISFKGFEGGIIHQLRVTDERKLKIGARVKPIFLPIHERKGSILDILHFELV